MILYNKILPLALCIACVACSSDKPKVDSDKVSAGEIVAVLEVTDYGDNNVISRAQFKTALERDPGKLEDHFVRLTNQDELWISSGDSLNDIELSDNLFQDLYEVENSQQKFESGILHESGFFSGISYDGPWYIATIEKAEQAEYQIGFYRNSFGQTIESKVNLPRAFDIVSPTAEKVFSRSTDYIELQWIDNDPGSPSFSTLINAQTFCPNNLIDVEFEATVKNDNGSFIISAGSLENSNLIGQCTTTITISRTAVGKLGNGYKSGTIFGQQVRRLSLITID